MGVSAQRTFKGEPCRRIVDAEQKVSKAVAQADWRTLVMQKDNLILNRCLVALEQQKIADADFAPIDLPSQ